MNRKKLYLIGPIPDTKGKSVGGVAEFDIAAAEALNDYYDVTIITDTDKCVRSNIVKIKQIKGQNIIIRLCKIYKLLKKKKPNIIISQLQYSISPLFINNTFKIHFVHGFVTKKDYSCLKRIVWQLLNYLIRKRFDCQIANSNFTAMINEKMLNNKTNYVVPLAINNIYLKNTKNKNRDIDILYVGRILKVKGVFEILNAVRQSSEKLNVYFIGDGVDKREAEEFSKYNKINVKFTGAVKKERIKEYYDRAKIFISLNEAEPFGLTYIEALSQGCKIIAPITGGQVESLIKFRDRVCFIDQINTNNILAAISNLNNKEKSNFFNKDYLKKHFSYTRVASDINEIIENGELLNEK